MERDPGVVVRVADPQCTLNRSLSLHSSSCTRNNPTSFGPEMHGLG